MKKLVLVVSLILGVMLLFSISGCQQSTQTTTTSSNPTASTIATTPVIKWKTSCFTAPPDVFAQGLDWWAKEVAKRTNGRMEVQTFWSQSLVPAPNEIDGLKSGLFEMCAYIPSNYPSKLPLSMMQFQPCIIPPLEGDYLASFTTFLKINDEYFRTPALVKEFANWDAKLAFLSSCPEYYRLIGNARVTTLDDLKGKKIRAVGGVADLLVKLGASTVATTSTEIYDGLSKGTVELACHGPSQFALAKLYEVSKYYIPTINLGNMGGITVMKKSSYDALPEDIKKIIDDINSEGLGFTAKQWAINEKQYDDSLEKAKLELLKFSTQDQQKIRETSATIWKEYVDKLNSQGLSGTDTFNSFQDAIKKYVPNYTPVYSK
jgi:TRAP-type C4-dicarboxylate transport system substrate-binding protein